MAFRRFIPILMWVLPLLFFAYQFILRLWPGLTMQHIMQQYHIDALSFGLLSAVYYVGYAGMQIPLAILLDRYSNRMVIGSFALLAGVATLIFTYADHWLWALTGRFLIGVASAVGFLGTSKAITEWFPHHHYGRMVGYTFSLGLLGALYGGRPVNVMINSLGVTQASTIIAGVGLAIGLLILVFYRNPAKIIDQNLMPNTNVNTPLRFNDLKAVIANPSLITLAVANLLMVGALEGFADIWGVSFIVSGYQVPKDTAASFISWVYMGMLVGGPVLAYVTEKWNSRAVLSLSGFLIAGFLSIILLLCSQLTPIVLQILLFILGLLCCYQVIVFSASSARVRPQFIGITIAFMNSVNMFGGSFFHSIIGYLMDHFWHGDTVAGCKIYTTDTYVKALMIIPFCAIIGGIIAYVALKDTRLEKVNN